MSDQLHNGIRSLIKRTDELTVALERERREKEEAIRELALAHLEIERLKQEREGVRV